MKFEELNFDSQLLEGLLSMGFKNPTPIQEQAIPIIMEGKDIIACAQTGTGKTGAYLLPLLHKIVTSEDKSSVKAIIIAPTRELALQIDQQVAGFAYFLPISSIAIYGGGDGTTWDQQKKALAEGVDIVIATPGRLIAQLLGGTVKLDKLEFLILDEADRMLDMGFHDDIMRIINHLPQKRQTLLFSATMPPKIRTLTQKILNDPAQINIAISKPAEGITQMAYVVHEPQKLELLTFLMKEQTYQSVIIFASTKENAKNINKQLKQLKFSCKASHSDLEQVEREEIMRQFKNRDLNILVGTDILSRGIDVEGIDLVVNYDVPPDPEDYIHRIGRTARAASTGKAITFISEKDQSKFFRIETLIGKELEKSPLPEFLGEGPVYAPHKKKRPQGGNSRGGGKGRGNESGRSNGGGNRGNGNVRANAGGNTTNPGNSTGNNGNRNDSGPRKKRPFRRKRSDSPSEGGGNSGPGNSDQQ